MFLTYAEQASVEFREHTTSGNGQTNAELTKTSFSYFFEEQPISAETRVPPLDFKPACNAAFCETAPGVWILIIHVSSSQQFTIEVHVNSGVAQHLGHGSVLFPNASLVSSNTVSQSQSCSNGPVQLMVQDHTACAAIIFRNRSVPCGMKDVVLGAQGCPPPQFLSTHMPALLSGKPYQDMCDPLWLKPSFSYIHVHMT